MVFKRLTILFSALGIVLCLSLFFPLSNSLYEHPGVQKAYERVVSSFDNASDKDAIFYVGYDISNSLRPMAYIPWFLASILVAIVIGLFFYIADHPGGTNARE